MTTSSPKNSGAPVLDRAAQVGGPVPALDRVRSSAPVGGGPRPASKTSAPGAGHVLASAGGGSGGPDESGAAQEFRIHLAQLREAIGVVRAESEHVSGLIGQIQSCFESAHTSWQSPSASSFEAISNWFTRSSRALEDLLQDMARRMQTAYENYADAETANTHNFGG